MMSFASILQRDGAPPSVSSPSAGARAYYRRKNDAGGRPLSREQSGRVWKFAACRCSGRLDLQVHARGWDRGEGSYRIGGRRSRPGVRAVYAAPDPATAILDVAVHKGFRDLDTVAHALTSSRIADPAAVRIVCADHIPNPNCLRPGPPSAGQQACGSDLLGRRPFADPERGVDLKLERGLHGRAGGGLGAVSQEPFALDTRLRPAR
jgi:RES domain-containing protein